MVARIDLAGSLQTDSILHLADAFPGRVVYCRNRLRHLDSLAAPKPGGYHKNSQPPKLLKESEEKFRKIFMTSPDAVMLSRLSDGLLISVNPGFSYITGFTGEDLSGAKLPNLLIWNDPNDLHRLRKKIKIVTRFLTKRSDYAKKNGDLFYGLISASLIEIKVKRNCYPSPGYYRAEKSARCHHSI
jgi:PAS domain S-box-containing protein